MDEIDKIYALVEEQCDIDLDTGWEKVDAAAAKAAGDDKARVDDYLTKQVQKQRPRSAADFAQDTRRILPHPCLQAVDSPLVDHPVAWAVSGTVIQYVRWDYIPQLVTAWTKLGMPGGKPPCPDCWQSQVQLEDGRCLTVQQCYEQLTQAELKQLYAKKLLGKTYCHGWLRTPYRTAGLGKPELLMAFQYRCSNCPVAATTGRKDTRDSFFMASDKSLLEIMQQQGLRCFVDIMDLHRGARVGLNAFLAKFILHAVVKAGTIKFFQDAMKELGMTNYLQKQAAFYTFAALAAKLGLWAKQQQTLEQT